MAISKNILKLQMLLLLIGLIATSTAIRSEKHFQQKVDDIKLHPHLPANTQRSPIRLGEDTPEFWQQHAKDHIKEQSNQAPNTNVAKNVIMFLGDGMGLTTLAAARNYIGGEHESLSFERFPYTGLSKTYSVDRIVPDSACTATAYLCGVKGNYGTIGVNGQVARGDCEAMRNSDNHVDSIAKWAMDAGKAAGIVTTTRITHASPSGNYAHTADREWENDARLSEDCGDDSGLPDIALQLIHGEVGSRLKVMMGGGKSQFIDKNLYVNGYRKDGRNLIEEYKQQSLKNVFVETKAALFNVVLNETERLLGIFHDGHMDYHLDTLENAENTQPTLAEMTQRAIEFLEKEENGYILFVEGGKIDLGHHDTLARIALDETAEFSKAIELARSLTNQKDTLIVVTADHSHTFSFAGYQERGADIFGPADISAADGKPYLELSYANGPTFDQHYDKTTNQRKDPTKVLTNIPHDTFPSTVPISSETHGGEDVAVFAIGPWAHLFTGVYEQNTIPHMMAYAACVGEGLKAYQGKH